MSSSDSESDSSDDVVTHTKQSNKTDQDGDVAMTSATDAPRQQALPSPPPPHHDSEPLSDVIDMGVYGSLDIASLGFGSFLDQDDPVVSSPSSKETKATAAATTTTNTSITGSVSVPTMDTGTAARSETAFAAHQQQRRNQETVEHKSLTVDAAAAAAAADESALGNGGAAVRRDAPLFQLGDLDFVLEEFKDVSSSAARPELVKSQPFEQACLDAAEAFDPELLKVSKLLRGTRTDKTSSFAKQNRDSERKKLIQVVQRFTNEMSAFACDDSHDMNAKGLEEYLNNLDTTTRSTVRTVLTMVLPLLAADGAL